MKITKNSFSAIGQTKMLEPCRFSGQDPGSKISVLLVTVLVKLCYHPYLAGLSRFRACDFSNTFGKCRLLRNCPEEGIDGSYAS